MRQEQSLFGTPARFAAGLREVARGVHAWLQPNGSWGESNAALVIGSGESLLVDTLWTVPLGRLMLDALAPLVADAPIRQLVNTHADGDHCWANQLLGDGVEIVATDTAAAEMTHVAPGTLVALQRLGAALALSGRVPLPFPGRSELAGAGRFFARDMVGPYDFSGIRITPPTRTFAGTLALEAGGRPVELIEVGPAHTPGDLIVHLPDVDTVIAGDVLFAGIAPVMWAGPVARWIAALDRIEALDPAVVVPGHGPVCGLDEVRLLRDYWRFVEAAAAERFAVGRSPGEAALDILTSAEFAAQPFSAWLEPERIVVGLHTIRRHAQGKGAAHVSPVARLRILAETARVGRRLAERRPA